MVGTLENIELMEDEPKELIEEQYLRPLKVVYSFILVVNL